MKAGIATTVVLMAIVTVNVAGCAQQNATLPACVLVQPVPNKTPMSVTNKHSGQAVDIYPVEVTMTDFGRPTDIIFKGDHFGFPQVKTNTVTLVLPIGENTVKGTWEAGVCDERVVVAIP